jgi:hypothetical protein|tara:strand:- start:385 stop:576 length:192 start_codon:yes stop_codon:yes gene_type:complete
MSKIKELSKITTRYTNKEGVANPITQKYDFKKPTMVSINRQDMQTLHNTGRLEIAGMTILYEE